MKIRTARFTALPAAAIVLALLAGACSSANKPTGSHPETFDAAKALAASRNVPLLVDFYSPT